MVKTFLHMYVVIRPMVNPALVKGSRNLSDKNHEHVSLPLPSVDSSAMHPLHPPKQIAYKAPPPEWINAMHRLHAGHPQQHAEPYKAPPTPLLEAMGTQPADTDKAHPEQVCLPCKAAPARLVPLTKHFRPIVVKAVPKLAAVAKQDAKGSQNAPKDVAKGSIVLESPVPSEIPLPQLPKHPPDSQSKRTEPTTNVSHSKEEEL